MAQTLTKFDRPWLQRWFEPAPFEALRTEMEQMFENFFGRPTVTEALPALSPRLDISETDEAVEVELDLPGFKPEEVQIDVTDNILTVSGEHHEEKEEKGNGRKYHRIERRSGSFSRSVWLPCQVNAEKVDARLKEGVLKITLPKAEKTKHQRITVKS